MVFLFILIIIICALIFSKIRIEIVNFKFNSNNNSHLNKDYKIIIKFCIFSKLTILKTTLTPKKLEMLKVNQKARDMIINTVKENKELDKNIFTGIKRTNIIIKNINFFPSGLVFAAILSRSFLYAGALFSTP